MKFTKKQRENISKALFDISKLILATLVLGQFITGKPFMLAPFLVGLIILAICFIIAVVIDK